MEGSVNNTELELYKILNNRLGLEIEEIYKIHHLFLLIATALIVLISANLGEPRLHIVIGMVGFFLALAWSRSVEAQKAWKDYWVEQVVSVETSLNIDAWQKIQGGKKHASVSQGMSDLSFGFQVISGVSVLAGIGLLFL